MGTCEVLLNPVDRPSFLSGIDHNQIRYTAPAGTTQDYRIVLNKPVCVVKGGLTYTLSAGIKTASASEAKLFEVIFRDADGVQIGDIEAPLATLTGTNAWNSYSDQYTTPEDAVFMEIYGHEIGEGTITITPPQIELGSSATSFDNGEIPSGLKATSSPLGIPHPSSTSGTSGCLRALVLPRSR